MNKFVSEKEIQENREKFGIKVEGEDENYDPRPLFEKLQEKKDSEEEAFRDRFKSQPPKAIDEDEFGFLQEQLDKQNEIERKIRKQDELQLEEFTAAQAHLSVEKYHVKDLQTTEHLETEAPKTTSFIKHKTFKKPTKKRSNALLASMRVIQKDDKIPNARTLNKQQTNNIKSKIETKLCESATAPSCDALSGFLSSYQDQ